jgi:hypothetical protein
MKLVNSAVLGAILIVSNTSFAQAQEQSDVHSYLTDKFFIDVGIYFPDRQFAIRVDSTLPGPTDSIDLQGDLGLRKSDEIFSLDFGWRFGEKWQFEGQYFAASGARGVALEEDVTWGDVVFRAGTGVKAGQDFSLIRAFFARRFESSEMHEFGIGAGLHWLEFGAFIQGNIIVGDDAAEFRRESVSAAAPLPNIGAWYMYSISPKLGLKTRVDWFSASIDEYDGTLINASLGLNYQAFENFGLGLNYNVFDLNVGVKKSNWSGNANISYKGPYAYVSFHW